MKKKNEALFELSKARSFGKNLVVYGGISGEGEEELFLKVTDYKKGYWAETPLLYGELEELIEHLRKCMEIQKWEGL